MKKTEKSYVDEWALLHGLINTTALYETKLNLKNNLSLKEIN
jgi:hypothetical protein